MAKISYKTKGDVNPQGMQKIYFYCHPEDFGRFFDPICQDIFATQNCAVLYNSEPEIPWNEEDMRMELDRVQLVVIPVTLKFLRAQKESENDELAYALTKHIPVLPLMQDTGIESEYEKVFGDLQFLDKSAILRDPTAIPYEQKLKRYLESILFGDELMEKIRAAFDAYIFISYRKKDRKLAQDLMRLIHKNDFCRDIAIWYDEYLVPGEGFNEAIAAALKKSELFTLVVTPSLLELNDEGKKNYVVANEYPAAVTAGKEILPVVMGEEKPDMDALRENLNNVPNPGDRLGDQLPDTTLGEDAPALSQALLDRLCKIALLENDSDPMHNYFIGLAYLGGIDVETDYEKATTLITSAAEADLPEAMEKLADMYQHGEGVTRNYETTAEWLEKIVEYMEKEYRRTGSKEDEDRLFSRLEDSIEECIFMECFSHAHRMCKKMRDIALELYNDLGGKGHLQRVANSYWKTGFTYGNEGVASDSREWNEKALEVDEQIAKQEGGEYRGNGYAILGMSYEFEGNLSEAGKQYEKDLEISKSLVDEENDLSSRYSLVDAYWCLSGVYEREGRISEAKEMLEKGAAEQRIVVRERGYEDDYAELLNFYEELGDLESDDFEKRKYYKNSAKILEQLVRNKELNKEHGRQYAILEKKFVETNGYMSDDDASLLTLVSIRLSRHKRLALIYEKLGDLFYPSLKMILLGKYFGYEEEYKATVSQAVEYYEKSVAIFEKITTVYDSKINMDLLIRVYNGLANSYEQLSEISELEGNVSEKIKWLIQVLRVRKNIFDKTGAEDDYEELAGAYYDIGTADELSYNVDMLKASESIWMDLVERHPDDKLMAENLEDVRRAIALAESPQK